MAYLAQEHKDRLSELKKYVEDSYAFYKKNYERFELFRHYLFDKQIDDKFAAVLNELNMPTLEFNVLYSYVARQLGEFSKQEPSAYVSPISNVSIDLATIETIQNHFRHIIDMAKQNNVMYNGYRDLLSGGFGVFELFTKYSSPMSYDQDICFDVAYSADSCGFDPLAQKTHKGDGRFCWKVFPMSEEDFKSKYPDIDTSRIGFSKTESPFDWSYQNKSGEKILVVCHIYIKKPKKYRIVQVVDNPILGQRRVLKMDEYEKFVEWWDKQGFIEAAPGIVGKPEWREEDKICRYIFVEDQVLDYEETIYPILPLIFFGNTVRFHDNLSGKIEEFTLPYGWHAKGQQDLKNYAGNSLANELQTIIQSKFMVAQESLPDADAYKKAYEDIQHASLMVYKAYSDYESTKPLPAPQVIQRQQTPPILPQAFMGADQSIQSILGSYDAALGINSNQLSGIAIVEGATQSNATGMPNVVTFMQGLTRVFEGILEIIPLLWKTPRTIPIKNLKGERTYIEINSSPNNKLTYPSNSLGVKVEAGVNYEIQKNRNMELLMLGMKSCPIFAAFMGEKGLRIFAENLPVKGMEQLLPLIDQYEEEIQQMKQQQAQMAQQSPDALAAQAKIMTTQADLLTAQTKQQESQVDNQVKMAEISVQDKSANNDRLRILADMHNDDQKRILQEAQLQERRENQAVQLAIKTVDTQHKHAKETIELHHKINSNKE